MRILEKVYGPRGITLTYIDATKPAELAAAIKPNTKLFWIETPSNPMLELVDIRACSAITRPRDIKLTVDNTFASPYLQRPLSLGADIVMHSTTKYISGHSDVIGGAVLVNDEKLHQQIKFYQVAAGGVPGPWDCWLTLRGVKTLAVRMRQHESNAKAVAEFLAGHPKIAKTIYPGLASHPQHELAKSQMDGFGAMVTFQLRRPGRHPQIHPGPEGLHPGRQPRRRGIAGEPTGHAKPCGPHAPGPRRHGHHR